MPTVSAMCRAVTEAEGPTFGQNFGGLLFRDTLNQFQGPLRCVRHGLNGLVAAVDYELNIALGETSKALLWRQSVSGGTIGNSNRRIPRAPTRALARRAQSFHSRLHFACHRTARPSRFRDVIVSARRETTV